MLIAQPEQPVFYPGVYRLQQKMTSAAALAALQDPASKLENSALLREGLTLEQTLVELSEGIGLPIEDFQAAVADPAAYGVPADSLEGWLFPAMYTFDPGVTAPQVIQTMVDRTITSLDPGGRARGTAPGGPDQGLHHPARGPFRAGLLQGRPGDREPAEARQPGDLRSAADGLDRAVRLRRDRTTARSARPPRRSSTTTRGTRTCTPACRSDRSPTRAITAIDAAMHPADGPWLYFVTVNLDTGETVFTDNYADHQRADRAVDAVVRGQPRTPGADRVTPPPTGTRLAVWGDPIAHSRSPAAARRRVRACWGWLGRTTGDASTRWRSMPRWPSSARDGGVSR